MEKSFSKSYAEAGVNIEAGYKGVQLMKKHIARTVIPGVMSDIGGFGGMFSLAGEEMKEPVLVSGTDGVGTKQRVAQLLGKRYGGYRLCCHVCKRYYLQRCKADILP